MHTDGTMNAWQELQKLINLYIYIYIHNPSSVCARSSRNTKWSKSSKTLRTKPHTTVQQAAFTVLKEIHGILKGYLWKITFVNGLNLEKLLCQIILIRIVH